MAEHLVIRLDSARPDRAAWVVVDDYGRAVSDPARGELAGAEGFAAQRRVIVLIPGSEVLLARARVPVKKHSRLLQALPFALEDQLAEDVERLHFAAGRRDADDRVLAAAVSAQYLEDVLASLAAVGIDAHAVYPDMQAVPVNPGSLTVVLEGARVYVAPPEGEPAVFDGLTLAQVLDVVGVDGEGEAGGTHLLVYCEPHHDRHLGDYWTALREGGCEVDVHLLGEGGALPRMAAGIVGAPGVNLLQGAYAPRSPYGELWPRWRLAAMLLLGLGVVAVGARTAEYVRLQQAVNALDGEIETVFRRTFGDVPVSDYRRYVRQQMGVSGADADQQMLETLSVLGEVLGRSDDTRVLNISYRRGVMDVRLQAPDVATLDTIRRRIVDDGLESEIQGANPVDDGVEGRLQLSRRGA